MYEMYMISLIRRSKWCVMKSPRLRVSAISKKDLDRLWFTLVSSSNRWNEAMHGMRNLRKERCSLHIKNNEMCRTAWLESVQTRDSSRLPQPDRRHRPAAGRAPRQHGMAGFLYLVIDIGLEPSCTINLQGQILAMPLLHHDHSIFRAH